MTPEIRLLSPEQKQYLNLQDPGRIENICRKEAHNTFIHFWLSYLVPFSEYFGVLRPYDAVHETVHKFTEEALDTLNPDQPALERADTSLTRSLKASKAIRNRPGLELTVSWISLLCEVHNVYKSYWIQECKCDAAPPDCCDGAVAGPQAAATFWNEKSGASTPQSGHPLNQRTDVAVSYRLRSWDLYPDDVIRPLASSKLGDIVVIAMRLGMHWRELQISKDGGVRADGGGYNLSSTSIRGLGMVLLFDAGLGSPGQTRQSPALVSSKYADKMMCGILPADPELIGQREFPLIGEDRKLSLLGNLLNTLNVSERARAELIRPELIGPLDGWFCQWRRTGFNDLVCLIPPFLPLEGSRNYSVLYRGFLGMNPYNTFSYWEGRRALWHRLTSRVKSIESPQLSWILHRIPDRDHNTGFFKSQIGWPLRHFHDRDYDLIDFRGTKMERGLVRVQLCREVFNETTEYFKKMQSGSEQVLVRFKYLDLVGAHCSMAVDAGFAARDVNDGKGYRQKLDHSGLTVPWPYEIAWTYADFVERGDIHKDLSARGWNITKEKAEEAWWMLMLRGMVWEMSVFFFLPEEVVPASFYGNQTPMWIM